MSSSRSAVLAAVLRGFSQCAFQANEITGLVFIVAVLSTTGGWRCSTSSSVFIATLVARLLRGDRTLLGLGLFGFNSGLMGLALGNFFNPIRRCGCGCRCSRSSRAVTVAMAKWLPIPFLAAPFILTFWMIWPIKPAVGLQTIDLGEFADAPVSSCSRLSARWERALRGEPDRRDAVPAGMLIANWRHAVIAAVGALVAVPRRSRRRGRRHINSGFIGFNAVLAAVATYALVAADVRLGLLAALTRRGSSATSTATDRHRRSPPASC